MPKKLNVSSNERIDLPDFIEAANTFTDQSMAALNTRVLSDKQSRTLNGFRVVIEDQTAVPGQITVYNGDAIDTAGDHLHNEDQENASISVALAGSNQTFYVEVQYIETPSDSDYRAFWDPTAPNTSPIPNGQEVPINVATRLSPSWTVVTPISTTGFDVTTNPSSTKFPLCILRTDGSNVIGNTQNANLVQVVFSSVLGYDAASGASSLKVLDSRLFGDSGNIIVDFGSSSPAPQTVAITANDRTNNILTINPVLTDAHLAGAIIRADAGTSQFIRENTNPNNPDLATSPPNHEVDQQRRFFQGDEFRGAAIATSKETFGQRDDLNIQTLKDHTDFLAAQIREIKFGKMRADSNQAIPPSSFNAIPRYYDAIGGLAGARNAFISIGDGVTTFGDINGSTDDVFTRAVAVAPAGSKIFIKPGTYSFSNTVTATNNVTFEGEGIGAVILVNNIAASGPLFSLGSFNVGFKNILFTAGSGAENSFDAVSNSGVYFDTCYITGFILSGATAIYARNSFFQGVLNSTAGALSGVMESCSFISATFTGLTNNLFLNGCTVNATTTFATFATASVNTFNMADCYVVSTSTTPLFTQSSNTAETHLSITGSNLTLTSDGTSGEVVSLFEVSARNTSVSVSDTYIDAQTSNTDTTKISYLVRVGQAATVNDCSVSISNSTLTSTVIGYTGVVKNSQSPSKVTISNSSIYGYQVVRDANSSGSIITITGSNVGAVTGSTIGASFVRLTNAAAVAIPVTLTVTGCSLTGPTSTSDNVTCFSVGDAIVNITNNVISSFTAVAGALSILSVGATQVSMLTSYTFSNNKVYSALGGSTGYAVSIGGTAESSTVVCNNEFFNSQFYSGCILVSNCKEGSISGNIIRDSALRGVAISTQTKVDVKDNQIYSIAVDSSPFAAITSPASTSHLQIVGNKISSIAATGTTVMYGITVSTSVCLSSSIDNNVIDGITASGAGSSVVGIQFGALSHGSISGNVIKNIGTSGGATSTIGLASEGATAPAYVEISGNYIESNGTASLGNYAIKVNNPLASKYLRFVNNSIVAGYDSSKNLAALYLIYVNKGYGVSFIKNDIIAAFGTNSAIWLQECQDSSVLDNNIQGYGNLGDGVITVYNTASLLTNTKICRNQMHVITDGAYTGSGFTDGTAGAINVACSAAGVTSLTIDDNILLFAERTTSPLDVYGILVASGTTTQRNINICGNSIDFVGTSGMFTNTGRGIAITNSSGSAKTFAVNISQNNIVIQGAGTSCFGITVNKLTSFAANGNSVYTTAIGTGAELSMTNCSGGIYSGNMLGVSPYTATITTTGSGATLTAGTNKTT